MDRSLVTLLRSLRTSTNTEDAVRLLPTATALLTKLSNPLNVSLLSSQILENDLFFLPSTGLFRPRQIFSLFYTAALRFRENQRDTEADHIRSTLQEEEWTAAVIKGAGESSSRWRHTLMIGGLLLAHHDQTRREVVRSTLTTKLESALVTAANLSLAQRNTSPNDQLSVAFVLNNVFPILSDVQRARLDCHLLLPLLISAAFLSSDGLEHGYWLRFIDQDVRPTEKRKFTWPAKSPSFTKVQEVKSRPFTGSLGSLSNLIAYSVHAVQDRAMIMLVIDQITEFASNLLDCWRGNKLSEVALSEEVTFLDQETIGKTLPILLHILRDTMFAIVIILRAILGRVLNDMALASNDTAPELAIQALRILRDTYFISHRFGHTSSSQFAFVNLVCLDILSQYPSQAESFLSHLRPLNTSTIPQHPLERLAVLFFLNTAEHLTLVTSPLLNQDCLHVALPYIQLRNRHLNELSEAAHSTTLAVFAAPQNFDIISHHIPVYIDNLLSSFPQTLSPRQFRLAVKSVVRLASPSQLLATKMPLLQAIVLDLLQQRFGHASIELLTPDMDTVPVINSNQSLSEKAVLLLSIIDCLCFLPFDLLEQWLPLASNLLYEIQNPEQRELCRSRLWEALSSGEMDAERATIATTWWTMRGGREQIIFGEIPEDNEFPMIGAIEAESKL